MSLCSKGELNDMNWFPLSFISVGCGWVLRDQMHANIPLLQEREKGELGSFLFSS